MLASVAIAPAARAADTAAAAQPSLAAFTIDSYAPTPDTASVGGRASLNLQLHDLQTNLQATVEGGGVTGAGDPFGAAQLGQSWTGSRAALTTTWTPLYGASLELDLTSEFRRALSQLDRLAPNLRGRLTNTSAQSAKAVAVLTPGSTLELRLGGEAASAGVQTSAFAAAGVLTGATALSNDTARAFAEVTWKPVPRFSLDASEALEDLGVAAQGSAGSAASYGFLTPRVAGTLDPWTDAALSVSAERAVAAPNAAQYASFVATAGRTGGGFQPDREWRYVAGLKQTLAGSVSLSASLTQSNLESVTDLGPVGLGQAPVGVGGAQRRRVDVALAAPLPLPGLPGTKLSASADWLESRITDPFTGQRRPISGDAAYRAELNLSGALRTAPVTWALKAQFTGPQAIYQMSQVDLISPMAGLGGTIGYRAGPVTLGLQLDNIVGGTRTDTSLIYAGSRAFDQQDAQRQTRDDGRAVRFTLTRAL